MPGIFRQLYYHVVWATWNREPSLLEGLRPHLFEVIHEKCRRLSCQVHALNAVEDHVHLALEIPPSRAVAYVVGQVKGASSHALNQLRPGWGRWQEGSGVVTFRRAELETVCRYVATQEERHRANALSPFLETWDGEELDEERADEAGEGVCPDDRVRP